jgi:hypothetical protein
VFRVQFRNSKELPLVGACEKKASGTNLREPGRWSGRSESHENFPKLTPSCEDLVRTRTRVTRSSPSSVVVAFLWHILHQYHASWCGWKSCHSVHELSLLEPTLVAVSAMNGEGGRKNWPLSYRWTGRVWRNNRLKFVETSGEWPVMGFTRIRPHAGITVGFNVTFVCRLCDILSFSPWESATFVTSLWILMSCSFFNLVTF